MNFEASLDRTAKVITTLVTLLFIGIIANGFISDNTPKSMIYTAVSLVLVYVICWLLSPLNYTVTNTELQIKRPLGKIIIKKEDIKSVDVLQEFQIGGAIRTFGVGGLFGYYGKYFNQAFGSMNWYMTRSDKPVLITTLKSKIVVSPDETDQFAEILRKIN